MQRARGDLTNGIGTLRRGLRGYVDGPYGSFTPVGRDHRGIVLIAGGVAFAPVIGILRQLRAQRYDGPFRLIYGNRVETQIMYRGEIEATGGELDLRANLVLSEPPAGWPGPAGDLTPDVLGATLSGAIDGDYLYFICEPSGMMTAVENSLVGMGVPPNRIITERFKYD